MISGEDESVGVRELRQNLTKYLRRVAAGETLRVLSRGRPVAVLAPLPGEENGISRLERAGELQRARSDLAHLGPPLRTAHVVPISRALAEQRAED